MIGPSTLVVTTVHPLQVLDEGEIPVTAHDVSVDLIVTPDAVIEVAHGRRAPAGIRWDELTEEKIGAIPLLGQQRPANRSGR